MPRHRIPIRVGTGRVPTRTSAPEEADVESLETQSRENVSSPALVIADNLDRTLAAAEKDTLIRRDVELTRDKSAFAR